MNSKSRITSILQADNLDTSITGLPSFSLSDLDVPSDIDFVIPTNLRLGHLAESVVAALIKASTNYDLLYENVQLIDDGRTIGEIDFIIKNKESELLKHVELAYKFYLYDPKLSSKPIHNWIGPNRNDSLSEKLTKTRNSQFPLLYHDVARSVFSDIEISEMSQALCLLVTLFVPYGYDADFSPEYNRAIKGFYIGAEKFKSWDHSEKIYYIPSKKEWGIDPATNDNWTDFYGIADRIDISISERQAPLVWQRCGNSYMMFFIVWW